MTSVIMIHINKKIIMFMNHSQQGVLQHSMSLPCEFRMWMWFDSGKIAVQCILCPAILLELLHRCLSAD